MRVLFVAAQLAGPPLRGDQQRARHLLAGLAHRHSVSVLDIENGRPVTLPVPRAPLACERFVRLQLGRGAMAMNALAALPTKLPLQAALYNSPSLARRVRAIVAGDAFDLVHVQLARLGPLLPVFDGIPVVLDFIDALSLNMERRAIFDTGLLRGVARLEAGRLVRYERTLCRQVAAAMVCSARDRDAIGDFANLHVVGNGVEPGRLPPGPKSVGPHVIFTGNLGYFPNVDAASWFIDEVLPRLRRDEPDLVLELAGARPARRLRALASRPGVLLTGPVADMELQLSRATVAIAPMRAGSGQQTKILAAMAAGTPVVASSLAAAGLEAIDGEHLLVADAPDAFGDAVRRLLHDPALRARLSAAARLLVETTHGWERVVDQTERIWLAAAGSPSSGGGDQSSGAANQSSGGGDRSAPAFNAASSR